ncbi:MAG: epoxyqueuosine reductase QueH [Bacteroidales bacterium OttesenSCG-928-I14]|jgi:predicted adenine nucleotide alpha hydrolase (AANH) superfamily ATPase|nr:epoxyqueuosine reductase QueH [Bacteroidales bacterium OttesenSCG-928-I14]
MILLHACCAPCSVSAIEWALAHNIRVTIFFFNPNIYPREEYEIRKNELIRYAKSVDFPFINGRYDHKLWLTAINGLEKQPENGIRCIECFKMRLYETAKLANLKKIKKISTTLTSSKWKNIEQITEAGEWAISNYPSIKFLGENYVENKLLKHKQISLKKKSFYNQSYCGCEFSNKKL